MYFYRNNVTPGAGPFFWPQGHYLNNFGRDPLDDAPQALKPVISEKNIFEHFPYVFLKE